MTNYGPVTVTRENVALAALGYYLDHGRGISLPLLARRLRVSTETTLALLFDSDGRLPKGVAVRVVNRRALFEPTKYALLRAFRNAVDEGRDSNEVAQ